SFERMSASEVYTFIIAQMESLLTSTLPDKSTGANFGRVDKRTLNHFLSKVYLSRGWEDGIGSPSDFDKAISYGKAAIGTDRLTLSFADVFKVGNEKNAEIIFSVQWDAVSMVSNTTDGNMQGGMFGTQFDPPLINKNPYITGTLVPGRRLYEIFKSDDERYQVSFLTTIYTYALDYYFMTSAQLANTNITHYYPPYWATSDADIAAWRAVDPAHRTATKVHKFDNVMFTDVNNYARAILKKCLDPTAQIAAKASTRDVFLARLSETYLNVAEAYLKKDGNGSNALSYVNEVRGRAKTALASSGDLNIDYILDERARETAGEYCRWNDLKRTGKLKEYASKYNSDIKSLISLGTDPFKGADGNDKILRPIPSSALDANQADMPQNPGY
ncbi:MAG TPA: RagB/SusD family nutrient uptake outer membrane protein, partial [Prolixibacteraceae bacterium]|nr:RagB/SusD family nutrient uptake outer membrane protein [Prolixibacteraceae bacterium]